MSRRIRFLFLSSALMAIALAPFAAHAQGAPPTPEQAEVQQLLEKVEGSDAPPALVPVPAPEVAPVGLPVPGEPLTPAPEVVDGAASPGDVGLQAPLPVEATVNIPTLPDPALPAAVDENLFYDSDTLVPAQGGGNASTSIPRKVNPIESPASKMIVVTKDANANTGKAKLVHAQRAVQLGRYDSALRLYNDLYAEDSRDPNVLLGRAVTLQKLGQTDESIRAYEDLLAVKPDNIEAKINMLGLIGDRYPAVALQRLNELNEQNPRDVRVLAQVAVMQARSGHYDDALAALGQAASIEQNNANHLYNMAVVADRKGSKEEAIRYYEKALEIDTVYGGSRSIPRESVYERLAQIRQ